MEIYEPEPQKYQHQFLYKFNNINRKRERKKELTGEERVRERRSKVLIRFRRSPAGSLYKEEDEEQFSDNNNDSDWTGDYNWSSNYDSYLNNDNDLNYSNTGFDETFDNENDQMNESFNISDDNNNYSTKNNDDDEDSWSSPDTTTFSLKDFDFYSDSILCPYCQKEKMTTDKEKGFICKCGFDLPANRTMQQMKQQMREILTQHHVMCGNNVAYELYKSYIVLSCKKCSMAKPIE